VTAGASSVAADLMVSRRVVAATRRVLAIDARVDQAAACRDKAAMEAMIQR
jgi:hypothetical protein